MTREDYKDVMLVVLYFAVLFLVILRMTESEQKSQVEDARQQVTTQVGRCRSLCVASGTKMSFLEFKLGTTGPYACRCQESQ